MHNAYRLVLDGPSMRKLQAEEALAAAPTADSPAVMASKPAKGGKK